MDLIVYFESRVTYLVLVLWIISTFLKTPHVKYWMIVWNLLFSFHYVFSASKEGLKTKAVSSGSEAAEISVFGHQIAKQTFLRATRK